MVQVPVYGLCRPLFEIILCQSHKTDFKARILSWYRPYNSGLFMDVRGWQFLTIEADETLCMVCLPPEEHIFRKKYLGNRPFKKSHFVRVWPSNLYFYGSFKNCKMNFPQNWSSGGTPSALLSWLKNYYIIDLKIELSATNINITNDTPFHK